MEEINWNNVPRQPEAVAWSKEKEAALKAEVAERQACIKKGFTNEQVDAHISLWIKEQPTPLDAECLDNQSKI